MSSLMRHWNRPALSLALASACWMGGCAKEPEAPATTPMAEPASEEPSAASEDVSLGESMEAGSSIGEDLLEAGSALSGTDLTEPTEPAAAGGSLEGAAPPAGQETPAAVPSESKADAPAAETPAPAEGSAPEAGAPKPEGDAPPAETPAPAEGSAPEAEAPKPDGEGDAPPAESPEAAEGTPSPN
jgi:hypothetical protein